VKGETNGGIFALYLILFYLFSGLYYFFSYHTLQFEKANGIMFRVLKGKVTLEAVGKTGRDDKFEVAKVFYEVPGHIRYIHSTPSATKNF
jgi:hypothetical protein